MKEEKRRCRSSFWCSAATGGRRLQFGARHTSRANKGPARGGISRASPGPGGEGPGLDEVGRGVEKGACEASERAWGACALWLWVLFCGDGRWAEETEIKHSSVMVWAC